MSVRSGLVAALRGTRVLPGNLQRFIAALDAAYVPIDAGRLLGVKQYSPAQTIFSTAGTSLSDVDATNMAVTFSAPASGKVLVRLSAYTDMNSGAGEGYWGLRESTTNLVYWRMMRGALQENYLSAATHLTGLSAGSHTYKWAFGVDSGTIRIIAGPGNAMSTFPGATMEVWAVA